MELVLAGESRPDTTDLNIKIIIKKRERERKVKRCACQPGRCVWTLRQERQTRPRSAAKLAQASSGGIKTTGQRGRRQAVEGKLGADAREPRTKTGFLEPQFIQPSSGRMRTEPFTQESVSIHRTALGLARLPSLTQATGNGSNTHSAPPAPSGMHMAHRVPAPPEADALQRADRMHQEDSETQSLWLRKTS